MSESNREARVSLAAPAPYFASDFMLPVCFNESSTATPVISLAPRLNVKYSNPH